jgi:hypothetical protein
MVFAMVINSCQSNGLEVKEPIRKNGIPNDAFWVGGVDGGNWYEVKSVHPHKNNAVIRIYNDQDGSLIVSKRFILVCPSDKPMWIDELKHQIIAFDGEKIYLKSPNGRLDCWLQ